MHHTDGFQPVELTHSEKMGVLEDLLAASMTLESRVSNFSNTVSHAMAAEIVPDRVLAALADDLEHRANVIRKLVRMVEDER